MGCQRWYAGCRWDAALQLCRFLKLPMLWACLAAAAMKGSHLEHATAAFAAIDQVRSQCSMAPKHSPLTGPCQLPLA